MLHLSSPATVLELPTGFQITVHVPEIEDADDIYTQVRFYRGASRTGPWTLIQTAALAADTRVYTYLDSGGLITSWYTWTLANATQESRLAEPAPAAGGEVYTRRALRRLVANQLDLFARRPEEQSFLAPSGVTTAGTTAARVVAGAYASTRQEPESFRDWYMLFVSGAATGEERAVGEFDPSDGGFVPVRPFTSSPGVGAEFDLYGYFPAGHWNEWVSRAAGQVMVPFEWPLVGVTGQYEYPLPSFVTDAWQITAVIGREGSAATRRTYTAEHLPQVMFTEAGRAVLVFAAPPAAGRVIIVRGVRPPPRLEHDDEALVLSPDQVELLVATAAVLACERLALQFGGSAEDRSTWAARFRWMEARRERLAARIHRARRQRFPGSPLVSIHTGASGRVSGRFSAYI